MDLLVDPQVLFYTEIIKSRLAYNGIIDANILQRIELDRTTDYNEHFGRYIGFFTLTGAQLGFIVLVRDKPQDQINNVFAFYVNTCHSNIPAAERQMLDTRVRGPYRSSITNIHTTAASFLFPSVLVEAVCVFLRPNMVSKPPPLYLRIGEGCSLTSDDCRDICPSDCDLDTICPRMRRLCSFMENTGITMVDLQSDEPIPFLFNILKIKEGDHYCYGINCPSDKAMMIILPHAGQFANPQSVFNIFERVNRRLGYKIPHFAATRIVMRPSISCNSAEALEACLLAVRGPFLYIMRPDIELFFSNENLEKIEQILSGCSQESQPLTSQLLAIADGFAYDSPVPSNVPSITLRLSPTSNVPRVLSVSGSNCSQETIIMSQAELQNEVDYYYDNEDNYVESDSSYPSIGRIEPRRMPDRAILDSVGFFYKELKRIVSFWSRHALTKLCDTIVLHTTSVRISLDSTPERFLIFPMHNNSHYRLLIVDSTKKRWFYINPDMKAANCTDLVSEIRRKLITRCNLFADWDGQPLLITSYYHTSYGKIHLLMALYNIFRLFKYTVDLPKKIAYGEHDFRKYCHEVCLKLQLANQEFNLRHNLVTNEEIGLSAGMVSLPSPLVYERVVVPHDQCPFCKKRGYNNLGRHISMAHGGQAVYANLARQDQYGYKSGRNSM